MCLPSAESHPAGLSTSAGRISPTLRNLLQIPDHPACREALALAESTLPAPILFHSLRVYLYAQAFPYSPSPSSTNNNNNPPTTALQPQAPTLPPSQPPTGITPPTDFPLPALFVACLLHDLGTAPQFDTVPRRFEVCGADAVASILSSHSDIPGEVAREAWLAVALHTSPGIAEAVGGVVRAVRLGVLVDFGACEVPEVVGEDEGLVLGRMKAFAEREGVEGGVMGVIERELPRLEVEKVLGDRVVEQAVRDKGFEKVKAPGGSWSGDLVRVKDDLGADGVNKAF